MRFDSATFGDDCMVKESIFKQVLFSPSIPGILTGVIKDFDVRDATNYF